MSKQVQKPKSNPPSFKEFFLVIFTSELIKHSQKGEILELKKIIKEEKKETKDKVKGQLKEKKPKKEFKELETKLKKSLELPEPAQKQAQRKLPQTPQQPQRKPILRIPTPRLPQTFQYLRPTPTSKEIDIGKLNPLIKDPLVNLIECDGPEEPVVVQGAMGRKPTNIFLNKDEIDNIIKKFSEKSKIPIHTGTYRVVAGRLILTAIISDVLGSKFVIKKMRYNLQRNLQRQNQNTGLPEPPAL